MEITSVKVTKKNTNDPKFKGFAEVVIDNCFLIEYIRIIQGKEKMIIAMPSRQTAKGPKDVAHPLTKECRAMFEEAILDEYNKTE